MGTVTRRLPDGGVELAPLAGGGPASVAGIAFALVLLAGLGAVNPLLWWRGFAGVVLGAHIGRKEQGAREEREHVLHGADRDNE